MNTKNNDLGEMLIYAARYAHTRNTGAAMQVVNCAVRNWNYLDERTQKQLVRESKDEATCNHCDWKQLEEKIYNGSFLSGGANEFESRDALPPSD